ncbi:MAG: excinuclease ABC subunit UvrA [Candidatus Omnitrophica bacterium]|nr:excinuclease ABC subunit UvrA [Candidatus Omnitrophota bacterium]
MMDHAILMRKIRTHNLKDIDVVIPHRTLTVVTGVSGSGKSSLAFDTLYAEGRRRYVESLSTYSRQFLERIERPDLDFVSGILPSIAIEVKNVITNARSTVGTQTELNDYFRLLFARIGVTRCTSCGRVVYADHAAQIFEKIIQNFSRQEVLIAFPLSVSGKALQFSRHIFDELEQQGFLNFFLSGQLISLEVLRKKPKKELADCLVVMDQLEVKPESKGRFLDSLEGTFQYGKGLASLLVRQSQPSFTEQKFSNRFHCAECNIEYRTPDPNHFSFNSPLGACPECQGFGRIITIDQNLVVPNPALSILDGAIDPWTKPSCAWELKQLQAFCKRRRIPLDQPFAKLKSEHRRWILEGCDDKDFFSVRDFFESLQKKTYKMHVRIFLSKYRGYVPCPRCRGARLKPEALAVTVGEKNIAELSLLTVVQLKQFFDSLSLTPHEEAVAGSILMEIKNRLSFLAEVGLGYLTPDRLSRTLSGGEAQRIHLAASLGSALVDTLYVLDEPSVGLHDRDNALLIRLLKKLKELGNTVVVVEHDRTMIEAADQVIDLGPLGGERGGEIVFSGAFSELRSAPDSYTARYFRNELKIDRHHRSKNGRGQKTIQIQNASEHNLKDIQVEIPLHQLVVITGVSGSGKSTLMYDVLYGNYERWRGRPIQDVGRVERIEGWNQVRDLLFIDQSPIGRTPRSNPVTYVKAFDPIRRVFSRTREAKARRMSPSHFSFNVPGGRCEKCEGAGTEKIEMHFLADIYVTCEVCGGSRYQPGVLEIQYHGRNIRDVLEMTVEEATEFFREEPKIGNSLSILLAVGLGYLRLGQSAPTLSGGEAQRLKLAYELSKQANDNLFYLFDEPTTGLHYYDIAFLLRAFETLLERGHSICVIEHNMEVIKCADYIIDLGPEGGEDGGAVVYQGPLDGLLKEKRSHTGAALKKYLANLK